MKIDISYHKYNKQLGNCTIEVPNEQVTEVLHNFKNFFSQELQEAVITPKGANTVISFQAEQAKIAVLQELIAIAYNVTAQLN